MQLLAFFEYADADKKTNQIKTANNMQFTPIKRDDPIPIFQMKKACKP
jgi:hypothetical protein